MNSFGQGIGGSGDRRMAKGVIVQRIIYNRAKYWGERIEINQEFAKGSIKAGLNKKWFSSL